MLEATLPSSGEPGFIWASGPGRPALESMLCFRNSSCVLRKALLHLRRYQFPHRHVNRHDSSIYHRDLADLRIKRGHVRTVPSFASGIQFCHFPSSPKSNVASFKFLCTQDPFISCPCLGTGTSDSVCKFTSSLQALLRALE